MVESKVVRRRASWLLAFPVMAALACPVLAAPVDAEQGNALTPRNELDLKTAGDQAAQAGANAAAAAHGIPILPQAISAATSSNTANPSTTSPAGATALAAKDAASAAKPVDVDLRRAVRDAAKPVLDDISRSAVGSAVRGITSDDQIDEEDAAGSETAGRRRNWDGQQAGAEADNGTGRRRTDAELANDKVRAAFLFQALLDEVAPWAITAVVLYALFYTVRVVLALRRRAKAEKRERRRQHDRRRTPGATTSGTPTQR